MAQFAFEVLDDYMRLQKPSNDLHIRMILEFGSSLDLSRLRRAVRRSFDVVPILGSRLVQTRGKFLWDHTPGDYSDNDCVQVVVGPWDQVSLSGILSTLPNQEAGPQVRITLVRQDAGDTLLLVVNHMAFDGTGFKEYAYLLAQLYNEGNPGAVPPPSPAPSARNLESLFLHLTFSQKLNLLLQKSAPKIRQRPFFAETDEPVTAQVVLRRIPREGCQKILDYSHQNGVTVNDLLLAAFVKAIFESGRYGVGESIAVSTMVDLRRFAPKADLRFGNFASMMRFAVCNDGQDTPELVKEVHRKAAHLKENLGGLRDVFLLARLRKLLSKKAFERIITKRIGSIGISSSNLGILDRQRLRFQGADLDNASMMTSLKTRPGLQLTFSTFGESMTLSVCGYYSESDRQAIVALLNSIVVGLESLPGISAKPVQ